MDIVYSCDEVFAPHAAVSITSLFENNPLPATIRVFVLGNKLSDETISKLRSLGEIYMVTGRMDLAKDGGLVPQEFMRQVRVINMGNFGESLKELANVTREEERFPLTALSRIFAVKLLPAGVTKFLYLDSDTIIRRDISGIWRTDLGGFTVGMVPEPTIYKEVRKYLEQRDDEPYFNSGVILVDKSRWEERDITLRCIELLRKNHGNYKFTDQDVLNTALRGDIKILPPAYDFFSNYHYRSFKSLIKLSRWYAFCTNKDEYDAARKNPAIVHFAGWERPWYRGNFNPWESEYEKYLELSPYSKTAKIKGYEREMFFYHLMNIMTLILPSLRDRISADFYEKKIK